MIFCAALSETRDKSGNEGFDTLESIPDAVPSVLTEPPIEEQLSWHTLWPESHKLYGHGNELFSLCCDHQGKLVASSCKVFNYLILKLIFGQNRSNLNSHMLMFEFLSS